MLIELLEPGVGLVVFCGKDSEGRGLRNKFDTARSGAEAKAVFEVKEGIGGDPVARTGEEEPESRSFSLDHRKGGGEN